MLIPLGHGNFFQWSWPVVLTTLTTTDVQDRGEAALGKCLMLLVFDALFKILFKNLRIQQLIETLT